MQQIRGLIPSENNAYASSRTIKNLVSFLFSFVCYSFIQRTRKFVFIFCLLERYKKNINKCKIIIGDYVMLYDFVPLKAILSICYHRCFTYNWKNDKQRKNVTTYFLTFCRIKGRRIHHRLPAFDLTFIRRKHKTKLLN